MSRPRRAMSRAEPNRSSPHAANGGRAGSALGVGASGLDRRRSEIASAAEGADVTAHPIIDTHQHLWDLKQFRLPWTDTNPRLAKSFVMADYLAATHGLGVVKSIYMEVDVEPSQQQAEADAVVEICRPGDTPMVAAVVSGRPASPAFGPMRPIPRTSLREGHSPGPAWSLDHGGLCFARSLSKAFDYWARWG